MVPVFLLGIESIPPLARSSTDVSSVDNLVGSGQPLLVLPTVLSAGAMAAAAAVAAVA